MANFVKMKTCPRCGATIVDTAKMCPYCGQKLSGGGFSVYTVVSICLVAAFVLFFGWISNSDSSNDSTNTSSSTSSKAKSSSYVSAVSEKPKYYKHYNVTTLFDEMDENPLRAENNHQDEYVEIEGYLANIDSDGKYFSVGAENDDYKYLLDRVHCNMKKSENIKKIIAEMNIGDKIRVKGKITSIGEILGYDMDVDEVIPLEE